MATALEQEMTAFLEHYNEVFKTDGEQIAKLYSVPTITMRGDGSIHCFQTREEIAKFFQGVTDTYKREGTATATINDLTAVAVGERCTLVTLTWKNLRDDGSVSREWRQSYNIVRVDGGLRILASIFHLKA